MGQHTKKQISGYIIGARTGWDGGRGGGSSDGRGGSSSSSFAR
jgi:hypothetical protein